jgi:hypothetical protein
MLYRLERILEYILLGALCLFLLSTSVPRPGNQIDQARFYTRSLEFDYLGWMSNAAGIKLEQGALGMPYYLSRESRKQIVADYLRLTDQMLQAENRLSVIYGDPTIKDPQAASTHLRAQLDQLRQRQAALGPLAEDVLQEQVSQILAEQGLTAGGQPIPPVLFHSSPVPMGLIISPRDKIEQEANISLLPDLTIDQQVVLEHEVDKALNVSSLVVPIGGVGVYPTMVMQTTDLSWLTNTIAHEWTHNYLSLRPLGLNYDTTPQLRTMNETTASIVGDEVGKLVMQRDYPQLASQQAPPLQTVSLPQDSGSPGTSAASFDFRAEMHTTRVTVDQLLSEGKIDQAESYMEARRQIFWAHGYHIRKLNQAYFAFYGAYADVPGGAAGEDPVGPAVRALRAQSANLADFVNRISWMTSFQQLQRAIGAAK